MKRLLEKFEFLLRKANMPIVNYFNPGISLGIIQEITNANSFKFPKDLYALYEWKNGIDLKAAENAHIETWFMPFGTFTSLEESFKIYNTLANSNEYWTHQLFPVFTSTIGEYYLIDCDSYSLTYGMVFFYSPTSVDFKFLITCFDSFKTLVQSINKSYELGLFDNFLDDNEEFDSMKYSQVLKEMNPKSDFWKTHMQ